ncbi:hypothetical protein O163_01395 [Caldanaerobacter subterraneus subsp. yonseiensis KB-1]|uniref:Uncharacterized protein n=1 Tax=Caldanaerobacter subterraneus subsp. yonseiensis KB-1 TaxID=1388761 RepID=U5CU80_CALSX|nr:hypothetical protein O163_01395 [Caldanaerobacter subterraneus subsp. yonseiensis KB-1]
MEIGRIRKPQKVKLPKKAVCFMEKFPKQATNIFYAFKNQTKGTVPFCLLCLLGGQVFGLLLSP